MHALTLMLVFLSVVLLSFTCGTFAETAEKIELEKSSDSVKTLTEIWQEDNREVLVRNNRGAKDSSGTGKKKEKSFQSSTKLPKTNRNQENVKSKNVESSSQISQLESSKDEKSPGHHLKHKKTEFSHKKHSNTTTSKPKTKHQNACRYTKSSWSECDQKTNMRSRTLSLKKGDASCVQTRTIQKKCKKPKNEKACRYEKGTFSDCQPNGEMTRTDKLRTSSDNINCQSTRTITKKCSTKSKQDKPPKANSKEKKQKERKNHQ